ncbi:Bax inhibitor-1 family protein [Kribbella sp. HUAS MG21]|uniref:Bax inhibitor-1 family protein n=1 Tax=Kribbella sp. HUAS MG21 TaxID=3160966 RepID=UPI003305F688
MFALGADVSRDLHGNRGIVAFLAALGCLIGMQFDVRKSVELTVGLLGAFGLLTGPAVAPILAYYASANPPTLWQATAATAWFVTGFGAAGYATKRDLSVIGRLGSWALIGPTRLPGNRLGPPPRRLDPPRHPQRLPTLPPTLHPPQRDLTQPPPHQQTSSQAQCDPENRYGDVPTTTLRTRGGP